MDSISYINSVAAVVVNLYAAVPAATDITNPSVQFWNPSNGHIYEFVNSGTDWPTAYQAASTYKIGPHVGYLATITSASEEAFIESHLSSTPAIAYWLGGLQNAQSLTWSWVDGPENGTQFWQGEANGSPIGGNYNHWDLQNTIYPQPNNPSENYLGISASLSFFGVNPTYWFDGTLGDHIGKIVEYGGLIQILPNPNGSGTFTTYGIVNVTGSKYSDTLIGNDSDNVIDGGDGDDTIIGNGGKDTLTGGKGKDIFVFKNASDSVVGQKRDVIVDFGNGKDRIDLSAIDANVNQPGRQAFSFIEEHDFSGTAGELRFANGILSGDVNGDKIPDFEIEVRGKKVTKGDLIL